MTGFYIYETKQLWMRLKPPGALKDAPEIKTAIVSVLQDKTGVLIKKTGSEVFLKPEEDKLGIYLSQEETGLFQPGTAIVQVNVLFVNSERDVSTQGMIRVWDNQVKEVML